MEYIGINEECQEWRGTWQDSKFMADLNERQRERDFREGYMRGFEMAIKEAEKVTRVEVIQHSPPYNGRACTNYAAKDVEVQYQDGGRTLKVFIDKKCYVILATHLGLEIQKNLPKGARIDGIEAKGLDENFNLIVNHNPVLGRLAHSTPELIVKRMAATYPEDYFKFLEFKMKEDLK